MALNTGLIGQLPYMQKEDTSYLPQSFMHSYEIAKRQNDPLFALKAAEIEQNLQAQAIKISTVLQDRENQIQAMRGMAELAQVSGEIAASGGWTDPKNEARVWAVGKNYPALAGTKEFANVAEKFDAARAAQVKEAAALARIETMQGQLGVAQERLELEKQKIQNVAPSVQVIEGKKFLVNPRTGRFEPLEKNVTRQQLIAQNATKWMDQFGTPEEAAKQLGDFYDKNVAAGSGPPPGPVANDRVRVRNPEGKTGTISRTWLDHALKLGWQEIK